MQNSNWLPAPFTGVHSWLQPPETHHCLLPFSVHSLAKFCSSLIASFKVRSFCAGVNYGCADGRNGPLVPLRDRSNLSLLRITSGFSILFLGILGCGGAQETAESTAPAKHEPDYQLADWLRNTPGNRRARQQYRHDSQRQAVQEGRLHRVSCPTCRALTVPSGPKPLIRQSRHAAPMPVSRPDARHTIRFLR